MAVGQAQGELVPANRTSRIVIVGAGIAGLACALACARAGAKVEVLEAQAVVRDVPAHLDIVPNLLRDFARLGLAEECVRRGFAYHGIAVVDEDGRHGFDIPTPRLAEPHLPCAVGIAYSEMLALLRTHARGAGAVIHAGRHADAVDAAAGRVHAADGGVFDADLVVLAAGANSPLAAKVFGAAWRKAGSQSWWHALLPRPTGLDRSTWMAGAPGHRLLLVPVDMTRAGVAVVRTSAVDAQPGGATLRDTLASWGELPRRLARLMMPDTPTTIRPANLTFLEPPWFRGAVLCVGACANALPPNFGQSAAQAVEDAIVLGELLAARLDRAALLERFMARRGERARRVHELLERAARWTTQPEPATDLQALSRELGSIVGSPA
jgi:2-polyprenyl-6-methoxyphenol hydroxylase-like FAD-dependent oxidoreductase